MGNNFAELQSALIQSMLASQPCEQSAVATEFEKTKQNKKKHPKSVQIIAVTTQSTSATRRDLLPKNVHEFK